MNKFIITADTTADLYPEFFKENKVDIVAMPFMMNNVEYNVDKFISYPDFYAAMRGGAVTTTCQVSLGEAERIFEMRLKEGYDILHISFSSGMSGSYGSLQIVAKDLMVKYPNQRVVIIDSLSGGGGEGLLLYYAIKQQKEGKELDEIAAWLEANKLNSQHFFIVEDLMHLKKGGRISAIEALLGTILGIKPVLELSAQGKIVPVAKARGNKKAIEAMCELTTKHYVPEMNDFILVGHGDSIEKAKALGEAVQKLTGVSRIEYCYVNYLVGSHAGPGSLVVYLMGTSRVR